MQSFQTEQYSRCSIPATLIWPRQSHGSGCQSSEMAALLNSLSFAFTNSFLPKYRVKYYDHITVEVGYNVIGVYRWMFPKF